jgi:hypothetical protein
MKLREVKTLIAAVIDMERARCFYDAQQLGVGDYFVESVLGDLGSLRLHAGIHRKTQGYHRALCQRFPFATYYEIVSDVVQVVAILDMRREPTWIHKSLRSRVRK